MLLIKLCFNWGLIEAYQVFCRFFYSDSFPIKNNLLCFNCWLHKLIRSYFHWTKGLTIQWLPVLSFITILDKWWIGWYNLFLIRCELCYYVRCYKNMVIDSLVWKGHITQLFGKIIFEGESYPQKSFHGHKHIFYNYNFLGKANV